jgi:putative ABC transport system permease protein
MLEIRPILSALSRHKSSTFLITLQIAITFAVVVNAIAIINQRMDLMGRDSGLAEEQTLSLNINAFGDNYDYEQNYRADIEMIRNMPGVIDAAMLNQIPLSGSEDSTMVAASAEKHLSKENYSAGMFFGDSHTLNSFGVKLISGRNFTESEVEYTSRRPNVNVAIVTQSLANKLYPDGSALGKDLYMGVEVRLTIIGIVEKMGGARPHMNRFYDNVIAPYVQLNRFKRMMIRVEDQETMNRLLAEAEQALIKRNPNRVVFSVRSIADRKLEQYSGDLAMTKILWIVSILLILITALGIVGQVSFNVNQRIKQIGTRRALGAQKSDIQRYFIVENILITFVGLTIGTVVATAFNIFLVKTYSLAPIEWHYMPIGMAIMFAIGIMAVWVPALKASNIPPTIATRGA